MLPVQNKHKPQRQTATSQEFWGETSKQHSQEGPLESSDPFSFGADDSH